VNVDRARALNKLDVELAAQSAQERQAPAHSHLHCTSDIHLKFKLKNRGSRFWKKAVAAVTLARFLCGRRRFSAEDATRTDWITSKKARKAVVAAGARTVNLPDTVVLGAR